MARKFVRILLVTVFALALGGITACSDSGPAEQAGEQMDEAASAMGEAASETAEQEEEKSH